MIIDTMTKYEVMNTLRKEFDAEILPYYYRHIFPRLKSSLQQKCQREKIMINLGWETKETSNHNVFRILKRGDYSGDKPLFTCEFRWNGRLCYGNFFREGHVVVYQSHCLQRYAERVLNRQIDTKEVFYNYIVKKQSAAYNITLPTPTHEYSQYFGIANALFLGDFDIKNPKAPYLWNNTCISYNEAKYTQLKIMHSLHELQLFVDREKFDLSKIENNSVLKAYLKKYEGNTLRIEELKKYLIKKYLLWKLHLHYQYTFTELFKDEINIDIDYIEKYLLLLGVQPKSLSPFSKTDGVAWKGEIDFKKN